jgi:hypothetical protein
MRLQVLLLFFVALLSRCTAKQWFNLRACETAVSNGVSGAGNQNQYGSTIAIRKCNDANWQLTLALQALKSEQVDEALQVDVLYCTWGARAAKAIGPSYAKAVVDFYYASHGYGPPASRTPVGLGISTASGTRDAQLVERCTQIVLGLRTPAKVQVA